MAELLNVEWSATASFQLDNFYNHILHQWSFKEAERFLDQVQEFELIISEFPKAFIKSKRKRKYRLGLIHKHVSAVYQVKKNNILVIALIDNRSKNKFR